MYNYYTFCINIIHLSWFKFHLSQLKPNLNLLKFSWKFYLQKSSKKWKSVFPILEIMALKNFQ